MSAHTPGPIPLGRSDHAKDCEHDLRPPPRREKEGGAMSPTELAQAAADAIGRGVEKFPLVLNRRAGGGRRVKVFPGNGGKAVWGELACENADGKAVVYVDAMDVLAYLAAHGLVKVQAAP